MLLVQLARVVVSMPSDGFLRVVVVVRIVGNGYSGQLGAYWLCDGFLNYLLWVPRRGLRAVDLGCFGVVHRPNLLSDLL